MSASHIYIYIYQILWEPFVSTMGPLPLRSPRFCSSLKQTNHWQVFRNFGSSVVFPKYLEEEDHVGTMGWL